VSVAVSSRPLLPLALRAPLATLRERRPGNFLLAPPRYLRRQLECGGRFRRTALEDCQQIVFFFHCLLFQRLLPPGESPERKL
jgi:hypothetical protein